MQRIIVKNFGPLKDIDLEIKDYMIFLGPQASGKSTLAKLIYGFKEVMWLTSFNGNLWQPLFDETEKSISMTFLKEEWIDILRKFFFSIIQNQKSYNIQYIYDQNIYITLSDNNGIINIFISDFFWEKFISIEAEIKKELKSFKDQNFYESHFYENLQYTIIDKVRQKMFVTFKINNLLFVPDKRDINQDYQSVFYSNLSRYRNFFLDGFKSVENFLQNTVKSYSKNNFEIVKLYFTKILKGNYENINGGQIVLSNGLKVPLDLASSGQKEVIGILIILTIETLNNSKRFYVIEEPEAHLFPEAQKDITYLISLLANQEGNQVIITTHSHYILGALNILINAHRVGQTNPEEVEKIVPRELWVDKNRIFAGFLENGIIKDIYDDEAEMIKIQQLNAVAGEINKDFDRLLDLEFANENV